MQFGFKTTKKTAMLKLKIFNPFFIYVYINVFDIVYLNTYFTFCYSSI